MNSVAVGSVATLIKNTVALGTVKLRASRGAVYTQGEETVSQDSDAF